VGQLDGQLGGQLRGQLGQDTWFLGNQDAFWLALYEFAAEIGVAYDASTTAHLLAYKDYVLRCGWMYAYKEVAFVSSRPIEIHFDAGQRLHSEVGMAVRFRDGWGLYAWHGLRMPPNREWIVADRAALTAKKIDEEENTEFRRVMLEVYGFERYLAERAATTIDADELHGQPRRLLQVTVGNTPLRVVEVVNGSDEPDGTRRKFVLGAARASDRILPATAHAAVAASYGISAKTYREAVRT
jgi:hypothetical protein